MSPRRPRAAAVAALGVTIAVLTLWLAKTAPTTPTDAPSLATPSAAPSSKASTSPPFVIGPSALPPRVAVPRRPPLQAGAFALLPLGTITPRGWLRRQLQIQADGLGGHLDEVWPDVAETSGWLGGDGESWERGPYFLDGLVPLAWLLGDAVLQRKAARWLDWTLSHQRDDGGIGPEKNTDWWPNMVMLKVLTQYYEATGDGRVIPVMSRYFAHHAAELDARPLTRWAQYRWQDEVLSVLWLYDRTGETALLSLAHRLAKQGFDWKGQFSAFAYKTKVTKADAQLNTHVVNNAMALKASGVWWSVTGDPDDRAAVRTQLDALDRYHLLASGVHSGDEHYAGRDPSQGTELCAVVEGMFSVEHLLAILGDAALGDRLERMAFNALPAAFNGDMSAHQYDQQPNQVLSSLQPRRWTTNGPESNVFGLEPNFGCCTANFHQGWPKLVASLWMSARDGGLVAAAYGPSQVRTSVRSAQGDVPITIVEDTDYPFRDTITLTVTPERAVPFALSLRIPAWATGARIAVNGRRANDRLDPGTFHRIERTWRPGDVVRLELPMQARVERPSSGTATIERGPLIYALRIGEDWRRLTAGMSRPASALAADWEVHPTTPWNYGLALPRVEKEAALAEDAVEVTEREIGAMPFSSDGAPVTLTVRGRRVPEWTLVEGSADTPPSGTKTTEPIERLTLIPYGAAKLRITEFPIVAP